MLTRNVHKRGEEEQKQLELWDDKPYSKYSSFQHVKHINAKYISLFPRAGNSGSLHLSHFSHWIFLAFCNFLDQATCNGCAVLPENCSKSVECFCSFPQGCLCPDFLCSFGTIHTLVHFILSAGCRNKEINIDGCLIIMQNQISFQHLFKWWWWWWYTYARSKIHISCTVKKKQGGTTACFQSRDNISLVARWLNVKELVNPIRQLRLDLIFRVRSKGSLLRSTIWDSNIADKQRCALHLQLHIYPFHSLNNSSTCDTSNDKQISLQTQQELLTLPVPQISSHRFPRSLSLTNKQADQSIPSRKKNWQYVVSLKGFS